MHVGGVLGSWRDRAHERTFSAATTSSFVASVICIAAFLAAAWVLAMAAGGSKTAMPHAFYVAIVFSAVRFGPTGALATAIAAGILAGPLLPLDVDADTTQEASNWLQRLAFFVLVGQAAALLARDSMNVVVERVADRWFRRELEAAIQAGHLTVEYQPIISLTSLDVVGVEALLRWNHPERGAIPPEEFVRHAERAGCVDKLTRFVLQQAILDVSGWHATVLRDREMFKLAVNVSAADLSDPQLVDYLRVLLRVTAMPNAWLHLEVTETALVGDLAAAIDGLSALRELGVRIAVDDFGTGESSLAYLHDFRVDVLKMDRIFTAQLADGDEGAPLAEAIIAMAAAMGLVTVAEGVETPAQVERLREIGCDLAQGFFFAPSLRPETVEQRLARPS